jgi:hypothetical protein
LGKIDCKLPLCTQEQLNKIQEEIQQFFPESPSLTTSQLKLKCFQVLVGESLGFFEQSRR